MQIICNSCLSVHIYNKYLNQPYRNPFVSSVWKPKEMIKFIKYYKSIDYTNIKLSLSNDLRIYNKIHPCIKCNIDNILEIYYIHSSNYGNDIDLCKEIYFRRLSRFNINENVVFILGYGLNFSGCYGFKDDPTSYCIKFNTMNANTIQIVPIYHYGHYMKNYELICGKNNHILYVETDEDTLPGNIISNQQSINKIMNIIHSYDK